jgi:hypothetical protein
LQAGRNKEGNREGGRMWKKKEKKSSGIVRAESNALAYFCETQKLLHKNSPPNTEIQDTLSQYPNEPIFEA